MGPGMPAASGRDAIQKIDADMVKDPAMSLHFQSSKIDVASSGDLAYSRGTYTMTMTNPATKKPMDDHGSYVTDYKKQPDGSWKAVADIVTSEVPMVPAAPMKMKH
jgi:ketosteroid isomerase-like protein